MTLIPRSAIALLLLSAALAGFGCEDDPEPAREPWTLALEELDGALISVAGTSSSDVWTVGADTRDGRGALVLHYDGERFTRLPTELEEDLWWVHARSEDSVWMGGTGGAILHYDGERIERVDTPGTGTVFGIWGATDDDLWAVGGEPDVADGFIWHFDGEAWIDRTGDLPAGARGEGDAVGPSLFKVWGQSANDIWIVGMEGLVVHWDGEAFELGDSDTERRLFTVHGAPGGDPAFVAVGGFGDAVIVENDGTEWHSQTLDPPLPELFGVYIVSKNHGFAVGADGTVAERSGSVWKLLDTGYELLNPFHAVWVDPDGGVWAVGGDLLTQAPDEGMLLHRGKDLPHEIEDLD